MSYAVAVSALGVHNALGPTVAEFLQALAQGQVGLQREKLAAELGSLPFDACFGAVHPLPSTPVPGVDTRQLRLAWAGLREVLPALEAARARWGSARVGVLLGTSTGGLHSSEIAYRQWVENGDLPATYSCREGHAFDAVLRQLASHLQLHGPWGVISTACASASKALAAARRWIQLGVSDAVLVGGVDTLCLLTLMGFNALGVLGTQPCVPFVASSGMNVAEGAAWLLLERSHGAVWLIGSGESNDAHHLVTPHPAGAGAERAMTAALQDAGLAAREVDYVNAHGTGTAANDSVEAGVLREHFSHAWVQSTKGQHGHQLGASGATEAAICCAVLQGSALPAAARLNHPPQPAAPDTVVNEAVRPGSSATESQPAPRVALSNTLAFGGANACLVFTTKPQPVPAPSTAVLEVYIQRTSAWAPGWSELTLPGLRSAHAPEAALPPALLLPARERGRAALLTRMFAECLEGLAPQQQLSELPLVFGSAFGAVSTTLELLAQQQRGECSPLRFGSSVHNAAAGILAIALANTAYSTSIAAGTHSTAFALFEGLLWMCANPAHPSLGVLVGDELPPAPLLAERYQALAVGFLLSRSAAGACGKLTYRATAAPPGAAPVANEQQEQDKLLLANPCAAALAVLGTLHAGAPALHLPLTLLPHGAHLQISAL